MHSVNFEVFAVKLLSPVIVIYATCSRIPQFRGNNGLNIMFHDGRNFHRRNFWRLQTTMIIQQEAYVRWQIHRWSRIQNTKKFVDEKEKQRQCQWIFPMLPCHHHTVLQCHLKLHQSLYEDINILNLTSKKC